MIENYIGFVTTNWFTVIVSLVFVMGLLNYATSILEEQLSVIGKKMKIPGSVRGATLDAISSSLPEFLTAMVGLILLGNKGLEVGIGTIGGSAIFNILIIPAVVLLVYKGSKIENISLDGIKRDTIFYILSIVIFLIGLYFNQLTLMGILLILLYVIYVYYLYKTSLKHRELNFKEVEQAFESVKNEKISYLNVVLSLVFIYIGVEVAVVSASWIGEQLHISNLVIALILLAGITSIPDTLLSAKSAKNGNVDAGLSNAVGSNIFDICIGLGFPILIGTTLMGLHPEVNFNSQIGVFGFLILSTIMYFVLLSRKHIYKYFAYILTFTYVLFILYLVLFVK